MQLQVHDVRSITVDAVQHYPRLDGRSPEFWVRELTITDEDGKIVSIILYSHDGSTLLVDGDVLAHGG